MVSVPPDKLFVNPQNKSYLVGDVLRVTFDRANPLPTFNWLVDSNWTASTTDKLTLLANMTGRRVIEVFAIVRSRASKQSVWTTRKMLLLDVHSESLDPAFPDVPVGRARSSTPHAHHASPTFLLLPKIVSCFKMVHHYKCFATSDHKGSKPSNRKIAAHKTVTYRP